MRDIKFRVWTKRDKTLTYIDDFYWFEENMVYAMDDEYYDFMQYIGVRDKNGTEIYEGDIVIAINLFGEPKVIEIFWNDSLSGWGTKNYNIDNSFPDDIKKLGYICSGTTVYQDYKVIGNIYSNPDLLKTATVED